MNMDNKEGLKALIDLRNKSVLDAASITHLEACILRHFATKTAQDAAKELAALQNVARVAQTCLNQAVNSQPLDLKSLSDALGLYYAALIKEPS